MVLAFGIGVTTCLVSHKLGTMPTIFIATSQLLCLALLNLALRERALSS